MDRKKAIKDKKAQALRENLRRRKVKNVDKTQPEEEKLFSASTRKLLKDEK